MKQIYSINRREQAAWIPENVEGDGSMVRALGIGNQDFEKAIADHNFYIDKTKFIKEWWDRGDSVTLITRPRRFGKTLCMSMVEQFFSVKDAVRGDLVEGLAIWQE